MDMRVLPSLRIVALSATLACLAQAGQAASLFEAYRMARENDRQWRFAQARHLESREFVPQARSQLLPVVGVNASELSQTQQLTTAGVSRPEQQYPTSTRALTLRQPLLIARQLDGLRLAQARELQGDMNLLEEEQQLALRLADAYFNHLLSL
ncbi:MAG: TolC family protein, partial [Limnohabitans sp.]